MPKMKTNQAMAKRVRVRKSGSLKRKKAYHSHILTKKTTKRCRNLRQRTGIDLSNKKQMKKLLPYAG